MTNGWRERLARCPDAGALELRQHPYLREYVLRGDAPAVIKIADEVAQVWGIHEDGFIRIHTTSGLLTYDVIGRDPACAACIAVLITDADDDRLA